MCGSLSKSKLLSNGLPEEPVLVPLLFNLCADDIAIAIQHTNMTTLEQRKNSGPNISQNDD